MKLKIIEYFDETVMVL